MIFTLFIGFILRILNLLSMKSLWSDEFFSIDLASKPIAQVIAGSINDVHPPLYYLILHFFSRNEMTMRSLSVLAGLGLILAVYLLGKELFGKKVGELSAILVAISPYFLQSSHEIRSYSLFAFLVTLSTFFYFRGYLWWFIATAILSIYTEHFAWIWWDSLLILSLLEWRRLRAQAVIVILGIPSLIMINYQAFFKERVFDDSRMLDYQSISVIVKKIIGIPWHFTCGYRFSMMNFGELLEHFSGPMIYLHILFTLIASGLVFKGFINIKETSKKLFFIFWLVLPVILLGVFYPIRLDARYLSFAAPAFFLLLAKGIAE